MSVLLCFVAYPQKHSQNAKHNKCIAGLRALLPWDNYINPQPLGLTFELPLTVWYELASHPVRSSVTGFVTSFTIIIAFSIMFSSPTRPTLIWVVTSTRKIIECGHPQILMCTRKQVLIRWKWMYGVRCLVGKSSAQPSSTQQLPLKHVDKSSLISTPFLHAVKLMPGSNRTMHIHIPCWKPCSFFNHFLLIDWFPLVCGPLAVTPCEVKKFWMHSALWASLLLWCYFHWPLQ